MGKTSKIWRHAMDQSCDLKHDWFWWQVWSYLLHTENVISGTSKNCDKATIKGKRRKLVEVEVLLKCSIIHISESVKNFGLTSQYKDIDVILLVEQIIDMKLSYQLFANKFQASLESNFELLRVWKVSILIVLNENYEYFYLDIKLKNFQPGKGSIKTKSCYMLALSFCVWKSVLGNWQGMGKTFK